MGAPPELTDYINKCMKAGRTAYEIKYDLLNEGWGEAEVEQAFSETQSQQPARQSQQPQRQYTPQQYQQPTQQYQQPQQPQSYPPQQQPYQQPAQSLVTQKAPVMGFILAMVGVITLALDTLALQSRGWIDIFSSLSVVNTTTIDVGLIVLLVVFAAGIALGGAISMKRKPLPAGMLVILLSFIAMLTFSGMVSGLVGIIAGIIILIKK